MVRAQASTEFIIITAIIFIILMIGVSVALDLPSIASNLGSSSRDRVLETEDIGVLAHYFNSTNGKLYLINNLEDIVNLTITVEAEEVYSDLVLNPFETVHINFTHSLKVIAEYYSFNVEFQYVDLVNSGTYGYTTLIESETID